MLLDFITGRPERNLDTVAMKNPTNPSEEWRAGQIVQKLMTIQYPPQGPREAVAEQAAVLLMAKDQLSRLAAPARGDTIAYTAMYVDREGRSWWRRKSQPARARGSDAANGDRSLIALATEAFPHFQLHVKRFRSLRRRLLWLGIIAGLLIAQTSWDVGHGRDVLGRIDQLQKDWDTTMQANPSLADPNLCRRYQRGQGQPSPAQGSPPVAPTSTSGGPPPAAPTSTAGGAATVDPNWLACTRLGNIETSKEQARSDLDQIFRCQGTHCNPYFHVLHWAWLLCSGSELPEVTPASIPPAATTGASPNTPPAANTETSPNTAQKQQSEPHIHWQSATSVLTVFTSYVLPLLYGLLGTIIGAGRSIQNKIRSSELAPRDYGLTIIGAFLGVAGGLVIGIFLSPGSVPAPGSGNALGNVTLTAAGLAFLAGYASQSFFRFIDDVIAKVFPSDTATPPPAGGAH